MAPVSNTSANATTNVQPSRKQKLKDAVRKLGAPVADKVCDAVESRAAQKVASAAGFAAGALQHPVRAAKAAGRVVDRQLTSQAEALLTISRIQSNQPVVVREDGSISSGASPVAVDFTKAYIGGVAIGAAATAAGAAAVAIKAAKNQSRE